MSEQAVLPVVGLLALAVLISSVQAAHAGAAASECLPASGAPALGSSLSSYSGCGGVYGVPPSNEEYEQAVVEMVNEERAQRGLPPLKRVSSLDDAARYHATDMGQDNYSNSASYDRLGPDLVLSCSLWERIGSYYGTSYSIAENIGLGYTTPEEIVNGWMNSSGHQDTILSTENWETGVGYYSSDTTGESFWVQDFGRRPDYFPVIISNEAAETNSRNVSLYVYGEGSWDEMRLRNDDGAWTSWQSFQSVTDWTLNNKTGYRTVCVEMRAGDQTSTSCDTIFLRNELVLGNLPSNVGFTYSIEEQRFFGEPKQITPLNTGGTAPLSWTLTQAGDWYTAAPLTGVTPQSFWITCTVFETQTMAAYTGAITVTVIDPPGTENSSQRIDLTLNVVEPSFLRLYLPTILRN